MERSMNLRPEIDQIKEQIVEWRHTLHQIPETAFEEVKTADFIEKTLKSFGLEVNRGLAATGIVATLKRGDSDRNSSIALRADMDALNIDEKTGVPYCSRHRGKMHACGHDGHMAMLLGAAKYLSRFETFKGTVHFIFQPAEENAGGGGVMVNEGLFDRFPSRAVYGMHSFPTERQGSFAILEGPMMAAYDTFDIQVKGVGGHAAIPQLTKDPIVSAAQVIQQLQTIVSRNIHPVEASVVSVTEIHAGTAYNIIPEKVFIRGTTRYFQPHNHDLIKKRMKTILDGCASAMEVDMSFKYEERYPPLINSPEETEKAIRAASSVVGRENVNTSLTPIMGSEDFAFMTQATPGAYIAIGGGAPGYRAQLHQADFNFNDEILTLGVNYWVSLVEQELQA